MKKKIFLLILILLVLIYFFFIRNTSKKDGIDNIKEINNIINIDIKNINGIMKTVHTTNMVHAANKEIKNEYDFMLENNDQDIVVYLNDKKSIIKKDYIYKMFDIDNIDKCEVSKKNSKFNIKCNDYEINIYYSKVFKKYLKSIVKYNGFTFIYTKNNLKIKNDNITYNYNIISNNNYKLEINDNINVYYSNSNYEKYSISYNDNNFNVIKKDKEIIISIPCEIDKYKNLEITITESSQKKGNDYIEISKEELLKTILNEQIYSLFN